MLNLFSIAVYLFGNGSVMYKVHVDEIRTDKTQILNIYKVYTSISEKLCLARTELIKIFEIKNILIHYMINVII